MTTIEEIILEQQKTQLRKIYNIHDSFNSYNDELLNSDNKHNYNYVKKHILNDIKELKQNIILMKYMLKELRIFYIINKDIKSDYAPNYRLAQNLFNNLSYFIEKEIIKDDVYIHGQIRFDNYLIFNNYFCDLLKDNVKNWIYSYNNMMSNYPYTTDDKEKNSRREDVIRSINRYFTLICHYGEEILILGMLMKEKKLKCYENIIEELYPEKPDIFDILEMYPDKPDKSDKSDKPDKSDKSDKPDIIEVSPECKEHDNPDIKNKQHSISAFVIILIMIVFYVITVITVILLINYNLNPNHNYNTAILHYPMQCIQSPFKSNQIINKQNNIKDIMII